VALSGTAIAELNMTPERWQIVSKIFNEATALRVEERQRFLEEACAGDRTLMAEVESLLSAHEDAGDFIESPIVENVVGDISEMPTLTGTLIGHYRIDKSIGRGGMGDVYLATDTRLDRCVALKKLPEKCSTDSLLLKRLRNEARAAATLNHPNVATIYSIEDIDEKPFIIMEYVEGRTLDAVTPPEGMDIGRFLEIFIQVADAMKHAHENGIVHRDIKPGNIILTPDDTPKILDFGLAQISEDEQPFGVRNSTITQPGQIIGTPSYMSPEQAQGKEIDHRTDIFSLGVVMYEAVTGTRPFRGENSIELISNLLKTEPLDASELRPAVPATISHLLSSCMTKKRSDRLQTMNEVRSTLIEAKRILSTGTSTGSFARRLYRESGSVGVWIRVAPVIFVLVLATAAWFYFSGRTNDPPISFEKLTMRRLSDTNNVGYSQISPDGNSVAFATFEDDGTRALWIRRIDDRNSLQLVAPQPIQFWGGLAFSPDGGQVFYISADANGSRGTLFKVSSFGGPSRKLVDIANDVGGVSSSGERILFVRYGEPSQILSARTADGGDEQVVLTGRAQGPTVTNFRDPQYSADGRSVYFIKYDSVEGVENWSVEELTLHDGKTRTIFSQSERISELSVLPNSSGLVITGVDPASNLQQIFYLSLTDGKKTRLTNDLFFYFGVSVDHDGKSIVASQRSEEQRIWVGDADNLANIKPLNQDLNAYRNVDWTPDGRIVYDGYENNVSHIWIADADGKNLQKLTASDADDVEPKVSADGQYIVFTSKRNGRAQLWRMNIDGSNQIVLADVNGVTQAPKFAADGHTVVFEWGHEGKRALASVPVTGGDVREMQTLDDVPLNYLYYWAASPDGKYIARSIWDNSEGRMKIQLNSTSPGATAKVFNFWPSYIFKWTPDGRALIYRERRLGYQPESEVRRIDVLTGRSSQLVSASPEYIADFSYSRDSKKVALVRGKNTSNAVILSPAPEK
jgi:serine/threonine protein kinase